MKNLLLPVLFFIAGSTLAQTWQDVGGGTNSSSHGMCTWNGLLVNGGSFNNPCGRVATWNGTAWSCLGGGVGIVARASIEWNGNLVVVGDFWNNFQPCTDCNGIGVWDGTSWTALGTGFNNDVLCLAIWNGDLVAGGDFTEADGQPCSRIARWDGTTWQPIGGPTDFDNDIRCMVEYDGELWVGGDFNNAGGCAPCDGLTKWNGTSWVGGDAGVDIQGGVDSTVRVLYVNPNDGNLYMGGHFTDLNIDGVITPFNGVAMYDGSDWTPLGTGVDSYVRMIHEYNGNVIVGGDFNNASGVPANKIAKWNPTTSTWSAMSTGMNGYVKAGTVWNGTLYAGGDFTTASGLTRNYIASWYETPSTPPVANISSSATAACSGGCITFSDISTNSPTSWDWDFPGATITSSTAQNPGSICYSSPGTYTVTLEACNSAGCDISTMNVTITATPTVSFVNQTICSGSPATLTATPSAGGGTYLWSPGGQTTQAITVSPAATTNYQVTYTLNGCASATYTGTVTVNPVPDLVDPIDQVICAGSPTSPICFTCSPPIPGTTYSWTNSQPSIGLPAVGASACLPVFTATNVTGTTVVANITVTPQANGCVGAPEVVGYTVHPVPTVSFSNQTICAGQSATLIATPSIAGGTYSWSPGGQTTSSITVSPASTTNYQVTYTLNGCAGPAYSGTVTVNPVPSISLTPGSTICSGTTVNLVCTPDIAGGTHSWSPDPSSASSITVTPASTTTYTASYTLNGCNAADVSSTITVNPTPTISVPDETICDGYTVVLTATPSAGGGTYSWSPGGEITQSISVSPSSTATYTVTYTLNGCEATDASLVDVQAAASVAVNDPEICNGEDAYLLATALPAGGTFLWSPGGATTEDITVPAPGSSVTYTVTYSVAGCNDAVGVGEITVNDIPSVTVNDAAICEDETATLTAVPSVAGGTFAWSGGETTAAIDVSPVSTDTYDVTYTLNGCVSTPATATVTVNPAPDLGVTLNGFTLTADQTGASYQWINCATMNPIPGETGQTFNPSANGQYAVTVDLNGCTGTSSCSTVSGIGIATNEVSLIGIYPNPFNDLLRITIPESAIDAQLAIYDASGKLVHRVVCTQTAFDLDLNYLEAGVYNLQLQSTDGLRQMVRIVKL